MDTSKTIFRRFLLLHFQGAIFKLTLRADEVRSIVTEYAAGIPI